MMERVFASKDETQRGILPRHEARINNKTGDDEQKNLAKQRCVMLNGFYAVVVRTQRTRAAHSASISNQASGKYVHSATTASLFISAP
jgi:hypothetical protein